MSPLQKWFYRRVALSYLTLEVEMTQGGEFSLTSNQRETQGGRASGSDGAWPGWLDGKL